MTAEPHAWIDESIHAPGPESGFYLLAASICSPRKAHAICHRLRALVFGEQERLHWRDESSRRRDEITDAISSITLDHLIVVAPAEAKRQERARRKCLERLLFELDHRGVAHAWIESRQAAQDRRDQELIAAMVGTGALRRSLEVAFAKPLDDPMLWIPDAVAGMMLAALRDNNYTWLDQLDRSYELIHLRTRAPDSAEAGSRHAAGIPASTSRSPKGRAIPTA